MSDIYDDITKVPTLWNAVPAINMYKSFMFGMKAVPYIGDLARKVDDALPFGKFGDITTSSRYINAEKTLKEHPNIKLAVGDSLGGSVALELQKHHPELQTRTFGAPVVDLTGAINPPWKADPTVQRYRNAGDPISIFDSKAHTTYYGKFYDKSTLTHQYDNNAKFF